jgi:hypothetical protein
MVYANGKADEPVFPIWFRIRSPQEFISTSQISALMPAGQHSGFTILFSGL